MSSRPQPELLAPAGDLPTALAAFDAGADAVYGGLRAFNARTRAVSFDFDSFGKLCRHAQERGKKVYLTLNTLVKNSEFPEFARMTAQALRYEPDAVIVQDAGVLRFFRKFYPDIDVHASTQMGFHNSPGLRYAEKLGAKRVILERQILLSELRQIVPDSPVEIEVFVHGALCLSLSGACLFSSTLEGCSGNRGNCKQPCRRRYRAGGQEGYFLSPADLNLIEEIPELMRLGVSSFKIEGRLRKSDSVSAAVGAFRAVIDNPGDQAALLFAKSELEKVCGRPASKGFLSPRSIDSLIRPETPGIQGQRYGTVKRLTGQSVQIAVENAPLRRGDRIRIQADDGSEGVTLTLTNFTVKNRECALAKIGETLSLDIRENVRTGSGVYRVGSSLKIRTRESALLPWRDPVDLTVRIGRQGVTVQTAYPVLWQWENQTPVGAALKHPLSAETVQNAFSVTGDPKTAPYRARNITAELEENLFLSAAELKNLRQSFWESFNLNFIPENTNPCLSVLSEIAGQSFNAVQTEPRTFRMGENVFPLAQAQRDTEALVPFFIPESSVERIRRELCAAALRGVRVFRTGSLGSAALVRETLGEEVLLRTVFPFPVTNTQTLLFLYEQGFESAMLSVELSVDEMTEIAQNTPLAVEILRSSRIAVFSTRAPLPNVPKLTTPQAEWSVVKPNAEGISFLLARTPPLPPVPHTLSYEE